MQQVSQQVADRLHLHVSAPYLNRIQDSAADGQKRLRKVEGGFIILTAIGHIELAASNQGHNSSGAHKSSIVCFAKLLICAVEGIRQGALKLLRAEGFALLCLVGLGFLHGRCQEGVALAFFTLIVSRLHRTGEML